MEVLQKLGEKREDYAAHSISPLPRRKTLYLLPWDLLFLGIRKCDIFVAAAPFSSGSGLLPALTRLLGGVAGVNKTKFTSHHCHPPCQPCREPGVALSIAGSGISRGLSPGIPSHTTVPLSHRRYHHRAKQQWHLCIFIYQLNDSIKASKRWSTGLLSSTVQLLQKAAAQQLYK